MLLLLPSTTFSTLVVELAYLGQRKWFTLQSSQRHFGTLEIDPSTSLTNE
jgi:hypothetical protein